MKKVLLFSSVCFLAACATPQGQMDKTKRIYDAKMKAKQAGYVETDPRFIALDNCEGLKIETYDNSAGTEAERFKKARDVYSQCIENSEY